DSTTTLPLICCRSVSINPNARTICSHSPANAFHVGVINHIFWCWFPLVNRATVFVKDTRLRVYYLDIIIRRSTNQIILCIFVSAIANHGKGCLFFGGQFENWISWGGAFVIDRVNIAQILHYLRAILIRIGASKRQYPLI